MTLYINALIAMINFTAAGFWYHLHVTWWIIAGQVLIGLAAGTLWAMEFFELIEVSAP